MRLAACAGVRIWYSGLCMLNISHGVTVRSTALKAFSRKSYWSVPRLKLCSDAARMCVSGPYTTEYQLESRFFGPPPDGAESGIWKRLL